MSDNTKQIQADDIAKIDKNFKVETKLKEEDIVFYDSKTQPFELYGVYKDELDVFKRMPENVAESVNNGVKSLNFNTAGIRVRFSTDSDYIAIKCKMPVIRHLAHMAMTGTSGFELYETSNGKYTYIKTFVPPYDMTDGYESITYLNVKKMRNYEICFPLYNKVDDLYIGLREGSTVSAGEKYKYEKPILYYGASITQGGCASKPSNSYQSIISHEYDVDYINLGFSGNAKGEKEMAEYIATLDVSIFVCDYDYNAPDAQHLRETLPRLYNIYRASNPKTPIIFISAPRLPDRINPERKQVVFETYNNAVTSGDENVWFIDGDTFFDDKHSSLYTVDGSHPNDCGFAKMAETIGKTLEIILKRIDWNINK